MKVVSIASSLLMIFGCFMPWIQLNAMIVNRGIDNPDGALVLVAASISLSAAIVNLTNLKAENKGLFIVAAILGGLVCAYDFYDVNDRADKLSRTVPQAFGEQTKSSDFIGYGLYVILLGSIGLFLSGINAFSSQPVEEINSKEDVLAKQENNLNSVDEEIDDGVYKNDLINLSALIKGARN